MLQVKQQSLNSYRGSMVEKENNVKYFDKLLHKMGKEYF